MIPAPKVTRRLPEKCAFPTCAGIDADRLVFMQDFCGLCGKEVLVCMEHVDAFGVTLKGKAARGKFCCQRVRGADGEARRPVKPIP